MKLLFDNRLAPMTSVLGFIEAPHEKVAEGYVAWMSPIQAARNVKLETRQVSGSLESALLSLLPLTTVEARRFLFLPTQSSWTAFVDNRVQGTDAFSALSYLSKVLLCRSCSVTAVLEDPLKPPSKGPYGAVSLEFYEPQDTNFLNYGRTISAINDGGEWVFNESGTPFPFEDVTQYKKRIVKDRFTLDLLDRYLREFGIRAFEPDFYLPDGKALMVEKKGPVAPKLAEFSLDQLASRSR